MSAVSVTFRLLLVLFLYENIEFQKFYCLFSNSNNLPNFREPRRLSTSLSNTKYSRIVEALCTHNFLRYPFYYRQSQHQSILLRQAHSDRFSRCLLFDSSNQSLPDFKISKFSSFFISSAPVGSSSLSPDLFA